MPVYTYRGTNRAGASVSGEMTAANKSDLQNLLKRQQITASKMSEKGRELTFPRSRRHRSKGASDLHAPILGDD